MVVILHKIWSNCFISYAKHLFTTTTISIGLVKCFYCKVLSLCVIKRLNIFKFLFLYFCRISDPFVNALANLLDGLQVSVWLFPMRELVMAH